MSFVTSCLRWTFLGLFASIFVSIVTLWYLYQPHNAGTIYLPKARGLATITREKETGIAHIRGEDVLSAMYAQGYAHAQTRLWQMERSRRVFTGRVAELFGAKAVALDRFSRTVGFERLSQETYKVMEEEDKAMMAAYADGINDFIGSIDWTNPEASAKLLPPEFYVFGITGENLLPWTPQNTLALSSMMSFHLTWNWSQDYIREIIRQMDPELAELVEELVPFHADYLKNLVTVTDDEDLKEWDQYSEETLTERYHKAKEIVKRASTELWTESNHVKYETQEKVISDPLMDEALSSNNWAVHGDHTASGKPLIANDPHLGTAIPSFWQLQHVVFGERSIIGASVPGAPGIISGKSNNLAWAMTAPLTDSSDLWQETLNEDKTKYLLDGEWVDLQLIKTQIKIKGEEPEELIIRITHRGPILTSDNIATGADLFGSAIPKTETVRHYSICWGGQFPGEHLFAFQHLALEADHTVPEVMAALDKAGEHGYRGVNQNLVMADNDGNIGYMMLVGMPNRKDRTPYLGSRVFDGTSSEFDWDGLLPTSEYPRSLNPKKGYIVTANNRQAPEHAKTDIGASLMATARAQRIDEMIRDGIAAGKKFTLDDMQEIQQDLTDIFARRITPQLVKISRDAKDNLDQEQQRGMEEMLSHIEGWQGLMNEESIPATIYSYWQIFFYKSLLHKYASTDEARMSLIDNYPFNDFYQRLIDTIAENPSHEQYNRLCQGAYSEYEGPSPCAYNIARAFSETRKFLVANVSANPSQWIWRNVHVNEYANMPWSKTPLKPIFHRETPTGGNAQTPHVSKYSNFKAQDTMTFKSTHTANFKMVVEMGEHGKWSGLYSVDTGNGSNIFQEHYFSMNADHLAGNLYPMLEGKQMNGKIASNLTIRPLSAKPQKESSTSSAGQADASEDL